MTDKKDNTEEIGSPAHLFIEFSHERHGDNIGIPSVEKFVPNLLPGFAPRYHDIDRAYCETTFLLHLLGYADIALASDKPGGPSFVVKSAEYCYEDHMGMLELLERNAYAGVFDKSVNPIMAKHLMSTTDKCFIAFRFCNKACSAHYNVMMTKFCEDVKSKVQAQLAGKTMGNVVLHLKYRNDREIKLSYFSVELNVYCDDDDANTNAKK